MLDRTLAPPYKTVDKIDVPQASTQMLPSGIPLHFIDSGEQEVIKLELICRSGSSYETKGGVSFFTSRMLTEGTTHRNSSDIAEFLDFYGAHVEVNPGIDFSSISLYILRKYLGEVLPVLNELLTEATFPSEDLELQKRLKKDSLLVNQEKNQFVASRKIREVIFGSDHPYGRSLEIEMIDPLQREDLQAFFEKNFFNRPEVIMSGKVKEQDLTSLADSLVFQSRLIDSTDDAPTYTPQREIIIDKPDSLQSSIRLGKTTVNKKHPDYINLLVVNEILGGFFGSRLMKNIREEKGFTYGISSNIMNLDRASIQVIGTDVKKVNTQETLDEVSKEIRKLQTTPVEAEELNTVKNYMQGAFLSSITTPFSLADKFKAIHFHGLSYAFYEEYLSAIQAISPETIMRVANEQLKLEDFSTVVVGGK